MFAILTLRQIQFSYPPLLAYCFLLVIDYKPNSGQVKITIIRSLLKSC